MLFHLDLSLLEVIFIYTLKKGKKDIFSMFTHIPSLQLVTGLPDSNKEGSNGHVLVRGPWVGLMEHPKRNFRLNRSLKISVRGGSERQFPVNICCRISSTRLVTFFVLAGAYSGKRGRLVEWVEKASFVRLNKLFKITTNERNHQMLIST